MPAYGYVRQSRSDDDSPAQSPVVQEERIRALAAAKGDNDIVIVEPDLNVSGGKAAEARPGFAQIVDAIKSGDCSAVYAYDLSRLFRNLKEQLAFFEVTDARRVPVRFVEGAITDVAGATGKLMLAVVGAMNEWQREVTSEKIRASLARIERETGRRNGNRPYGDREGEDPKAVVAAFREAGSFDGGARLLNEKGANTRVPGAIWTGTVVAAIVRREAPELVPPAVRRGAPAGSGAFRFGQLLTCSTCGRFLTGSHGKGDEVRYACGRARVLPHARGWVNESKVTPVIRDEALRALPAIRRLRRGSTEDESKLRALAAKRARIAENYEEGVIDRPTRDAKLAAVADAESTLAAMRWIRRVQLPPDIDSDDPARVNAWLRRIFATAVVDMSQKAKRGPSSWLPTITFEWRDPSMRADDADEAA